MKRSTLLLLAMATLSFGACHSSRHTARTPQPDDTVASRHETPKRVLSVIPFTAEVEGMAVSGQLRMAEDSVMWLTASKFIEVGRAMATADSVFLHAPLMGREEAMDYATLHRRTGVKTSLRDLQQMALAPDASQRIADLADKLGFSVTVHVGQRRQVDELSFPFVKASALKKGPQR